MTVQFWRAASNDKALTGPALDTLELVGLGPRADVPAELLSRLRDAAQGRADQLDLSLHRYIQFRERRRRPLERR